MVEVAHGNKVYAKRFLYGDKKEFRAFYINPCLLYTSLPGISVPVGMDSKGLPVGMQLLGNCFEEHKILRAAYAYEQTRPYERPGFVKDMAGQEAARADKSKKGGR